MKFDSPPKRPISPFFLFREKLKELGENLIPKEIADKWKALSLEEHDIYTKCFKCQKEKYDKYLYEQKGIKPRSSCDLKDKPEEYKAYKVRDVCSYREECRPLEIGIPVALAAVTVKFITDFFRNY